MVGRGLKWSELMRQQSSNAHEPGVPQALTEHPEEACLSCPRVPTEDRNSEVLEAPGGPGSSFSCSISSTWDYLHLNPVS